MLAKLMCNHADYNPLRMFAKVLRRDCIQVPFAKVGKKRHRKAFLRCICPIQAPWTFFEDDIAHKRVFTAKSVRCDSPHLSSTGRFNLIFRCGLVWMLCCGVFCSIHASSVVNEEYSASDTLRG